MESLSNLVNSSMFFYVAVAVLYVLVIVLVAMLIVNNKKKRIVAQKIEENSNQDLNTVNLEAVLDKMQEDVSKAKDEVKTFEDEQEEKAIISYQELLRAVKKDVDEVVELEPNEVTKVDLPEVDIMEEEPVIIKEEPQEKTKIEKSSKFQNSEFISPIYGRVNSDIEYPKIPVFRSKVEEHNIDEQKGNSNQSTGFKSNDNNDDFLKALKEFRNNLE